MQCPKQTLQTNHQITIKIKDCVKRNRPKLSILLTQFRSFITGCQEWYRKNFRVKYIPAIHQGQIWKRAVGGPFGRKCPLASKLQSGGAALRKVSLEDNCTKPDIAIRFAHLDLH